MQIIGLYINDTELKDIVIATTRKFTIFFRLYLTIDILYRNVLLQLLK